mgnify:FL=1|tara:strand:+ start:270 stop:656 length:387 start_codon:yes stop_codon:yes gene_type:complete
MNKDMEKFLPPEEKNVDNDYKYSRDTYYELVEKGKESLELMIEVARESEHPRAFEVLSGMIKNISDVNDRLMDLNKKKKDLDKKEEIQKIANTTNNLFVGSTAELQKILKNESKIVNVTPESKPKLSR